MDKRVIENPELLTEALSGLQADPKTLHPKWFYDTTGSELFEQRHHAREGTVSRAAAQHRALSRWLPPLAARRHAQRLRGRERRARRVVRLLSCGRFCVVCQLRVKRWSGPWSCAVCGSRARDSVSVDVASA